MTKRVTPEIVIPSKQIESCSDCPFFEDCVNGYEEHTYYCQKTLHNFGEMWSVIPEREIWDKCPLPIVEE